MLNNRRLGKRIKSTREARGLTQKELAERINTHPLVISYWERGSRTPSLRLFRVLCSVLKVDANFLLGRKRKST